MPLQEADAELTKMMRQVREGDFSGRTTSVQDSRLSVRFYSEARLDEGMSKDGFHWTDSDGKAIDAKEAEKLIAGGIEDEQPKRIRCTCVTDEGVPSAKLKRENTEAGVHVPGGFPVYVDTLMVRIQIPGDRDNIVETVAWVSPNPGDVMAHNQRFPDHFKAYMQRKPEPLFGTPLIELTRTSPRILAPSYAKELESVGCRTAEQLVNMSAQNGQRFLGLSAIIEKTKIYLEKLTKAAPLNELRAELEKRDTIIAAQQRELKALREALESDVEAPPKLKKRVKAVQARAAG